MLVETLSVAVEEEEVEGTEDDDTADGEEDGAVTAEDDDDAVSEEDEIDAELVEKASRLGVFDEFKFAQARSLA